MIELRISHWEFAAWPEDLKWQTNCMCREYGQTWGLDHEFMFYWIKLTPAQYLLANLKYTDVLLQLKRAS
jgi:hypothetical protein